MTMASPLAAVGWVDEAQMEGRRRASTTKGLDNEGRPQHTQQGVDNTHNIEQGFDGGADVGGAVRSSRRNGGSEGAVRSSRRNGTARARRNWVARTRSGVAAAGVDEVAQEERRAAWTRWPPTGGGG
jgi:hypothetical protein